jgi:hypothetical protein
VTDFLADSPRLARWYCPDCEPDADPTQEILEVRWCDAHVPLRDGLDDPTVGPETSLSGSGEAGGETNRRWCEVLHGAARDRYH